GPGQPGRDRGTGGPDRRDHGRHVVVRGRLQRAGGRGGGSGFPGDGGGSGGEAGRPRPGRSGEGREGGGAWLGGYRREGGATPGARRGRGIRLFVTGPSLGRAAGGDVVGAGDTDRPGREQGARALLRLVLGDRRLAGADPALLLLAHGR